mmetsp:Transcript_6233/g.7845  ORF Transcript_6233/g.7845 Transcript_6233/m.7845 type:complete len:269 (-) Transcript_6233:1273-2079(-)
MKQLSPHEELVKRDGRNFTLRRVEFNKQENNFYINLLSRWFSSVQETKVKPKTFFSDLSDGVVICRILSDIEGSGVNRSDYHDPAGSELASRENLKIFREVAKENFNFPAICKVEDFHSENPSIIATLLFLAKMCYSNPRMKKCMPRDLRIHVKNMPDLKYVIPEDAAGTYSEDPTCWEKFVASLVETFGLEGESQSLSDDGESDADDETCFDADIETTEKKKEIEIDVLDSLDIEARKENNDRERSIFDKPKKEEGDIEAEVDAFLA